MPEKPEQDVIHVQVCFAKPGLQFLHGLCLPAGSTLLDAIERSAVLAQIPEIDLAMCRVGIYGKIKALDTVLREHDRVEIYRALGADPKESRRKRADKNKKNRL